MTAKKGDPGVLRGLRLSKGRIVIAGLLFVLTLTFGALAGCGGRDNRQAENAQAGGGEKQTIRLGYFPNITPIQAMVGQNDRTFQKALGEQVEIEEKVFNAGPKLIQALLTGEIDLGYIGPVPAINGYVVSNKRLRIIAGASNEGAILDL